MSEWLDSLPEPLREAPFLAKAENAEDAVAKLAHAAGIVGNSIRIPQGEDIPQETWDEFYEKMANVPGMARLPDPDDFDSHAAVLAKLGKPEEHTDYKLPELDGFEWDQSMGDDLRKYALQAGLTKGQFKQLASQIAKQEQTADLEGGNAMNEQRANLRTDWGDTLEEREGLIRGWLEHSNAPESMRELLDSRSLPLDTMNWLRSVAEQFKGDVNPITNDGKPPLTGTTPAEARSRIPTILDQLVGMPQSDPRYGDLQKELVAMHKAIDAAATAA